MSLLQNKNTWSLELGIFFIIFLLINTSYVFAISISEIESNPQGFDSNNEWVELYSLKEVDIENLSIKNNDGDLINLNEFLSQKSFQGYLTINLENQWLDNSDEKVFLFSSGDLIDQTPVFLDSSNDDKTWSLCGSIWVFVQQTKERENECLNEEDVKVSGKRINADLDFNEDFYNNEELTLAIDVYNLDNRYYDLKVYLVFEDDEKIISENYDEKENRWRSSNYYLSEFFSGSGDESKRVDLRLKQDFEDKSGDAEVHIKIRESESSDLVFEDLEFIDIIKSEVEVSEEDNLSSQDYDEESQGRIIDLDSTKDIKTGKESENIYQSKNSKVRNSLFYLLTLLCLFVVFIVLVRKRKNE